MLCSYAALLIVQLNQRRPQKDSSTLAELLLPHSPPGSIDSSVGHEPRMLEHGRVILCAISRNLVDIVYINLASVFPFSHLPLSHFQSPPEFPNHIPYRCLALYNRQTHLKATFPYRDDALVIVTKKQNPMAADIFRLKMLMKACWVYRRWRIGRQ